MSAALGRVTAWVSRLSWRGILAGVRIGSVSRRSRSSLVVLRWSVPDTEAPTPGATWLTEVVVPLPDDESEAAWNRRLLVALADAIGHELGEAARLDGAPLASPHERPAVWPWRVQDRESNNGGEA